jgi:hypothetical protein
MQLLGILAFGVMTVVNVTVLGLMLTSLLRRTRVHH